MVRFGSVWQKQGSVDHYSRDMVLVAKQMFWGMENHLRLFSEAFDRPEGQELGGQAVGGQAGG